ncbi:MAG: putative rRNA maturation factor [Mariniblastus sp.]
MSSPEIVTLNRNPLVTSPPYKIEIADEQSQLFDPAMLTSAVEMIMNEHGVLAGEVSIAVVDDPAIRKLNKQYLEHDYETDVISFVLEFDDEANSLVGQLIVSTDTAATMAAQLGGTMQEELLLYVIHGMLHLVGYNDKDPAEAVEMRVAEKLYLAKFGIEHRWTDTDSDGGTKVDA